MIHEKTVETVAEVISMHSDPKPKLTENEILLSTNTLLDCFYDMGLILTAPESCSLTI